MTLTDLDRSLRDSFLRWQCRCRQIAARTAAGQPTTGMIPTASALGNTLPMARFVTVLCRKAAHSTTMEFQHLARRTHDPSIRRNDALRFFAERYYQAGLQFSDTITASFSADSTIAARLIAQQRCLLCFEQFNQRFDLVCTVQVLPPQHPLHEATFWHNLLFNPNLSSDCVILGFAPDWPDSVATSLGN